jgi:hypothetical protein
LESKKASFIVIFVITEYLLKKSEFIRYMMKMNAGLKKLSVTLTITTILLSFAQINVRMVSSSDTVRKIDLFTQKTPFNGMGINQSSDAFEPQELVILYALVTYNQAPIVNNLVAFQVNNPANAFQNITVVGVSSTNQSGIAQFSFRIPWPFENAEQIVFGEWSAIGTVDITEQVTVDILTFQVGWIIKITNITTLNAKFEPQTEYQRDEVIVFDLTVENIGLIPKLGTIIVDVQDAASYPIIYIEMDNLVFEPGENYARSSSQIPITATIGEAKVLAAVYTAPPKNGGVLFSPAALSQFEIISAPVPAEKHDIAITSVSVSPSIAYVGTPVGIIVETVNLGNFTETFNVTIYYDAFKIATRKVESLDSGLNLTLSIIWDTVNVSPGSYTVWALSEFVLDEVNVTNNVFINGKVTFLPKPPPSTRLLNIISSPISDVNFTINGAHARTPYSATHIEGVYTIAFPREWTDPDTRRLYIFSRWEDNSTNRTRIIDLVSDMMLTAYYEEAVSTYTLSIISDPILGVDFAVDGVKQTTPYSAILEEKSYRIVMPSSVTDSETGKVYNFQGWEDGSTNLTRIVLLDRDTNLTAYYEEAIRGWFVPDWFYWLLPALLALIIVLLIIWFYRRRRKKAEDAFYSGWTAWYYCCDLRSKIPKI